MAHRCYPASHKLKPSIAVAAKEKQHSTLKKGHSVPQISAEREPIETRKEVAKAAGVSHDTLRKAEEIIDEINDKNNENYRHP